ncbi:MAG: hypothetical protein JWQ25_3366 [Daejeonella sp.]|nr:hypothetical protein [Daejeonella sp.]
MILYNVTVILEEEAESEWLDWMHTHHIQQVMNTGCFESCRIFKVLESQNEGITFSVQYTARDLDTYETYRNNFASKLQADLQNKFANRYVAFRTIMELIEHK